MTTHPNAADILASSHGTLSELVRIHAAERPDAPAVSDPDRCLTWFELNQFADRIAARLQADRFTIGDRTAIAATNDVMQVAVIIGTLRAGGVAGLITHSATGAQMAAMVRDTGAHHLFFDAASAASLAGHDVGTMSQVALDDSDCGIRLRVWIAPVDAVPFPVDLQPSDGFNIIYSSGTTGVPKGIVHSHAMRWQHIQRGVPAFGPSAVTLLSTPLYSNTTMASFLPTMASGGHVVLMRKFDAHDFLELCQRNHVTNTMLVPVQYRRIMAVPDFDHYDLSSFVMKYCTSAPFAAALKADVVARWPGGLVEIYGLTEGGGTCLLEAHKHPGKLHTVGRPAPGHEMRVIDEDGNELPFGSVGEIVGRSPAMMTGYHGRPEATVAMHWYDKDGDLFYRHGDIGRFDEDGFLTLMDRAKDMIISGGFNIYPSDLEAVLLRDACVADVAVVGVPSDEWGETPVAFVVLTADAGGEADAVMARCNAAVGKTQRLSAVRVVDELPRSAIGKVLKRELRDAFVSTAQS